MNNFITLGDRKCLFKGVIDHGQRLSHSGKNYMHLTEEISSCRSAAIRGSAFCLRHRVLSESGYTSTCASGAVGVLDPGEKKTA